MPYIDPMAPIPFAPLCAPDGKKPKRPKKPATENQHMRACLVGLFAGAVSFGFAGTGLGRVWERTQIERNNFVVPTYRDIIIGNNPRQEKLPQDIIDWIEADFYEDMNLNAIDILQQRIENPDSPFPPPASTPQIP